MSNALGIVKINKWKKLALLGLLTQASLSWSACNMTEANHYVCDTGSPNPSAGGVYIDTDVDNVTIDILPGAIINDFPDGRAAVRIQGRNCVINHAGTVEGTSPSATTAIGIANTSNSKITTLPGSLTQSASSRNVVAMIGIAGEPVNTIVNNGTIVTNGNGDNAMFLGTGLSNITNNGLVTLNKVTNVAIDFYGVQAGSNSINNGNIISNNLNGIGFVHTANGPNNSQGQDVNNGTINLKGDLSRGFLEVADALDAINNGKITITGNLSEAFFLQGSDINATNSVTGQINLVGAGIVGFRSLNSSGTNLDQQLLNNGIINIAGSTTVNGDVSAGVMLTQSNNATFTNTNMINLTGATSSGVMIAAPANTAYNHTIYNLANAKITSEGYGIYETTSGSSVRIDNAGTITGKVKAMQLGSGEDYFILRDNGAIYGLADGGSGDNSLRFINWQGNPLGTQANQTNLTNFKNWKLKNSTVTLGGGYLNQSAVTALTVDSASSILNVSQGQGVYGFQNAALISDGLVSLASGAAGDKLIVKSIFAYNVKEAPIALGNHITLALDTHLGNSNSATDRLLIVGDVSNNLSIPVTINNAGGVGAATGYGSQDGISIIQVGGNANANSFRLANNYVAVGPYQYQLYYFPKAAVTLDEDVSFAIAANQNSSATQLDPLLAAQGVTNFHDYRLQSVLVGGQPQTVPQVDIYRNAISNLFVSNRTLTGSYLNQIGRTGLPAVITDTQLAQIKTTNNDQANNSNFFFRSDYVGEGFGRVGGHAGRYRNHDDNPSINHNFGFVQLGWSGIELGGEAASFGLTGAYGHQSLRSRNSSASGHLNLWNVQLPMTFQLDKTLYVDVIPQASYNHIGFTTYERGHTASTHGYGVGLGVEVGDQIQLSPKVLWLPSIGLNYQHAHFSNFTDVDGLVVNRLHDDSLLGDVRFILGYGEASNVGNWWLPYAGVGLTYEFLGVKKGATIDGIRFDSGARGLGGELIVGLTTKSDHGLALYGEAKYVEAFHRGFEGFSATIGLRYSCF